MYCGFGSVYSAVRTRATSRMSCSLTLKHSHQGPPSKSGQADSGRGLCSGYGEGRAARATGVRARAGEEGGAEVGRRLCKSVQVHPARALSLRAAM